MTDFDFGKRRNFIFFHPKCAQDDDYCYKKKTKNMSIKFFLPPHQNNMLLNLILLNTRKLIRFHQKSLFCRCWLMAIKMQNVEIGASNYVMCLYIIFFSLWYYVPWRGEFGITQRTKCPKIKNIMQYNKMSEEKNILLG